MTARLWSINEIKEANRAAGYHFFAPGTMRVFNSRVCPKVFQGPGGIFFVTSESNYNQTKRNYTIRQFLPDSNRVETFEEFGKFQEKRDVDRQARAVAKQPAELRLAAALRAYDLAATGTTLPKAKSYLGFEQLLAGESQTLSDNVSTITLRAYSDGSGFWVDVKLAAEKEISHKLADAIINAVKTCRTPRPGAAAVTDEKYIPVSWATQFVADCRKHGNPEATVEDCRELILLSEKHEKACVAICNAGGDAVERQRARLEQRITELAQRVGAGSVKFSGDPRGATVKLVWANGATDDFGKEGWCVPTQC